MGIPDIDPSTARTVILPVPFEETTSYGHGTKNGPEAIIKASRQVELYDPEFKDDLNVLVSISTAQPAEGDLEEVHELAKNYTDKFLISLGGEHSITPALVSAFLEKYPKLSILQIDAHTDMRDEWEGTKYSHACAMRRVAEQGIETIVSVGIRNSAKEEQPFLNPQNVFWGNKFDVDEVMDRLGDDVYLTFDVDGLDLSIMPATGTPEPGGISYEQAVGLIKAVSQKKNVVAADFVELSPIPGMPGYDFLIAKLIYKLIGYKFVNT